MILLLSLYCASCLEALDVELTHFHRLIGLVLSYIVKKIKHTYRPKSTRKHVTQIITNFIFFNYLMYYKNNN